MTRTLVLFLSTIIAIAILSSLLVYTSQIQNLDQASETKITQSNITPTTQPITDIKILATGLDTPWSIGFLPDNSLLVTERSGNIRLITKDGKLQTNPIAKIKSAVESGEGGLLGIAVHPKFATNKYIYLYYTYQADGDNTLNRVSRFKFDAGKISDETIITDKIPGALFHNGGRIKFGPDNFLYITTGDAQLPSLAQTRTSLAGKILRVTDTGEPVPSNFFGTRVYSYGHRNPQGITWDENGNLWETEHGNSTQDELNKIENGKNYGWPTIRGDEKRNSMISPLQQSGTSTWAPGGITYFKNTLYFTGLRGNAIYKSTIIDDQPSSPIKLLEGKFGRIRDIVLGPDQLLYITTSNQDGRGNPSIDDDKIIILNPANF